MQNKRVATNVGSGMHEVTFEEQKSEASGNLIVVGKGQYQSNDSEAESQRVAILEDTSLQQVEVFRLAREN